MARVQPVSCALATIARGSGATASDDAERDAPAAVAPQGSSNPDAVGSAAGKLRQGVDPLAAEAPRGRTGQSGSRKRRDRTAVAGQGLPVSHTGLDGRIPGAKSGRRSR